MNLLTEKKVKYGSFAHGVDSLMIYLPIKSVPI